MKGCFRLLCCLLLPLFLLSSCGKSNEPLQWARSVPVQDVKKIEMLVNPSFDGLRYRLFDPSQHPELLSLINHAEGKFERNPETLVGQSIRFYVTMKDGSRHTLANIGNVYLLIDGVYYKAPYSYLYQWDVYEGNAKLPENFLQ